LNRYPSLPTAKRKMEESVPISTLEKIADSIGYCVWGEKIARGDPFPVSDEKGGAIAYVFPYFRNADRFPENKEIFDEVKRLRLSQERISQRHSPVKGDLRQNLSQLSSRFGSVYVSATKRDFPVLRISHFLHPYFFVGELAGEEAKRHLNTEEIELRRYYFLGPHEEYFEFVSKKKRILIHVKSLKPEKPEEVLVPRDVEVSSQLLREIKKAWDQIEKIPPILIDSDELSKTHTLKLISHHELIPVIDWTWWCVPTAYAMVFGFWDNYVKSKGTIAGYGRMIDYWFDHSTNGNNVPNLLDEMIDPNTKTWRAGFKWDHNFTIKSHTATAINGWLWKTIKAEIDSGKPLVWGVPPGVVDPDHGHAMTAFGYHIIKWLWPLKFIVVYNTWGEINGVGDPVQQFDEYYFTKCQSIGRVVPGAGTNGDHTIIISPDGGETLQTSKQSQIVWYVWGNNIKKTTLSFSHDGGKSWTKIADVGNKSGWNFYSWTPTKVTKKARIRIQGYSIFNILIAADGSQTDFTISSGSATAAP
jgi:hypothetical protein